MKFRFMDMRIWQFGMEITDELLSIADNLEERKLYRFAEQLRSAAMSMTNNIAEGSGSSSDKDFKHFFEYCQTINF